MNNDSTVQQIFATVQQLRKVAGDGPRTRKLLDALFRCVHNLKATAAANGLSSLAGAAHEFEDVLHSLRTVDAGFDPNSLPPNIWSSLKQEQKHALQQSLAEGALLFLVRADFDVADFDREFQSLKETLNRKGEVISSSPSINSEGSQKINFTILYAQPEDQGFEKLSNITIEALSTSVLNPQRTSAAKSKQQTTIIERAFEKLAAELANAPNISTGNVWQQAVQAGRAAAEATGKEVEFEIRGEELLRDQSIAEALAFPLLHLVRNAVDHGIERSDERVKLGKHSRGKVSIEITKQGDQITITVSDDGRGIDPTVLEQIFLPGFSTAPEVSTISGRGVGLDVVQTTIDELGGSIAVSSEPGQGSTFQITLPL